MEKTFIKANICFYKNTNDNYLTSNGLTKREIEVLGKDIKYIYNGNLFLKTPIQPLQLYIFNIFFKYTNFFLTKYFKLYHWV